MYRNLMTIVVAFYLVPSIAQNSSPRPQALTNFQSQPSATNARAVTDSCPAVPTSGSVYDRYDQAIARRQCLEEVQAFLIANVAAPASTDPTAARLGASAELLAFGPVIEAAKKKEDEAGAAKSFMGSNWALGIGYSFGKGPKRITEAEVVNGVVRVTQDDTDQPLVLLEAHHLFPMGQRFGIGPFASLQTGSEDAVLGFGAGVLFGWKDAEKDSSGGFLLGLGYGWTHNVKTLGDGIVADQPLPTGETEVRFKNQSAESLMFFVSRRFDLGPEKK